MNQHLNQLRLMRTTAVGANAQALDVAIQNVEAVEEIVKHLRKRGDEYDKPWFLGEAHALREAATVIETTYLRPPVRPKT